MIRTLTILPTRRLSLRAARFLSTNSDVVRYKYQDRLYLIPQDGNRALVSFSAKKSAVPIGELKNLPEGTKLEEFKATNKHFESNPKFVSILQKIIAEKVHDDFAFKTEAGAAPSSHLPIFDFRRTPAFGRAPDVDDVIGYVRVDDNGEIIPNSYEENPMYRLLGDVDGFIVLSDFLYEEMLKEID